MITFLHFDSLLPSFPQIEIGTLPPPDYHYPVPEAPYEEQVEEEEEEQELPITPRLIPQGSGGSGDLMGPNTQKGLKEHTPITFESLAFSPGSGEGHVPPQRTGRNKDRLIYFLNVSSASSAVTFSMCTCSI